MLQSTPPARRPSRFFRGPASCCSRRFERCSCTSTSTAKHGRRRLGGEEFAQLLPNADAQYATQRVQSLRDGLSAPALPQIGPAVTFSAGIAASRADEETLDVLLRRADEALYEAKANGRNQSVVEPAAAHQLNAPAPPSRD